MSARFRTFSLLLASSLAVTAFAAAPAQAAKKPKAPSYVATANGVVGVSSMVRVSAPRFAGRTVALQASQPGSSAIPLSVELDSTGSATAYWTPTAAGTWAVQGQGPFAIATGSSVNIAPAPTSTVINVSGQMQVNLPTDVFATVTTAAGSTTPQGSVNFTTVQGANLGSAPLVAAGQGAATARVSWTPTSTGYPTIVATYVPSWGTGGQPNSLASSATQTVQVMTTEPALTIRFPSTLRVGEPTTISGVMNDLQLSTGTVAMQTDVNGTIFSISGSIPLQNNVAEAAWTPNAAGNQIITASFSNSAGASASQTQRVNVLAPRPADGISTGPAGQQAWPVGADITLPTGSRVSLAIGTQSGAPTTVASSGACVIINNTLLPIATSGNCQVVVSSTGNAQYAPANATYNLTIARVR